MKKTVAALVMGALIALGFSTNVQAGLLDNIQKKITDSASSVTGGSESGSTSNLSTSQIIEGLKEALQVGTETVVAQIGTTGGYNDDPAIHIPLPEKMQQAQSLMKKFGLSGMADDLEERLNRGAEAAAPKTKEILMNAISEMTVEDAQSIYSGPDDAATQYFRKVSTGDLTETIRPIIEQSLQDVGAISLYDSLVSQYKTYPLVPDIKTNLTDYTTDMTLEGLFHYLAEEEAAIRNDPVKRTTEILTTVFGN
ncbi:DUF4197 domain-containing protein [uncultured Sneathiella sp.]|uniref:DUF4197 domain-containing protein n=1 Tax=uncultured Sneathiella sp. TaxID=879315 RepID=UPI0030DD5768|tara:strand:- start:241 stop:999 length:759 start_codon:yes stop_codon:yes gene_type:complete